MSGFSPDWLDLREPADARARSRLLLAELFEHTGIEGLRITDLGCGTGATARALTGYLQKDCEWLLVDHDPALLAAAQQRLEGEIRFRIRRADLA
ncbi:MAG: methyltransferase domain-containing protein, partial [Alphaproteobacteria bacterium]